MNKGSTEKRTSINSYNKRVVELNLHHAAGVSQHTAHIKNQISGISSIPVSACNSKQVSLDISEAQFKSEVSRVGIEHKKKHSKIPSKNQQDITQQAEESHITSEVPSKNIQLSLQISPRTHTLKNLLHSPRFSVAPPLASVGGSGIKNKLVLRKSASKLTLNKSDQFVFSPNTSSQQYKNHALSYRSNSPTLTNKVISSMNKKISSSSKKYNTLQHNLSSEKSLRVCQSTQDLNLQPSCKIQTKEPATLRVKCQNTQNTLQYSPSAITINKALSRISSIGEMKKMKEQILQQSRKSIANVNTQKLAQYQQVKYDSRKTGDGLLMERDRLDNSQGDHTNHEDAEDYLINQEKLWNAIETKQSLSVIKELLKQDDVDANARNIFDDGWTALHYAAHEGYFEVVKLLIESHNSIIDARTSVNKTPFHLACRRGFSDIIQYMMVKGANTSVVDRDGCTPLHYLCETDNLDLIKLLLPACKGCKDVRNRHGKKPVDLVTSIEVKKFFRQESRSKSRTKRREGTVSKGREVKGQTLIQVHKVSEEGSGMQQLFSKFALYKKNRHQQLQVPKVQSSYEKNRDLQSVLTKSNSKVKLLSSPQNLSINTARPSLQINPNISKQEIKAPPQSCTNASQRSKPQKSLFTSSNPKITRSPAKPKQLFNYAKHSKAKQLIEQRVNSKMTNSNTQQNEGKTGKIQSISKEIEKILKPKQAPKTQRQQKHLLIELDDEDDDISADSTSSNNQPDLKIPTQKDITTSEGQMLFASGQTGDSSNHQNQDSTDQIPDQQVLQEDNSSPTQPQQEEKVGPWSFIAHQLLGTGSFGEVYLVEKISNGRFYAMKVLTKAKIMGHNLTRYAMTERNVLSIADHPFIVKLNYAFQTQDKLFLILDYCPGGDLAEYLQLEKRFNEDKTRLYVSEILLALEELHRKDIIFRDLKPDNVVLDHEGHALLTDFGLSKEGVLSEGMAKSFCGSYAYLAPEMLRKMGHGKAVDWYLLGVVMYEMLCGVPPYYANNKEELFKNIKDAPLEIPLYVSSVAKDLIIKLMNRNPKKRLGTVGGAEEVKKHPFFKNIDWGKMYKRAYRPPEPYLRKRFENFLQLTPAMQTNAEVYESLRKYSREQGYKMKDEQHISGWSFVSPQKE